ncbi:MAG: hypothetical protein HQK51_06860 [Oligoflexia bacterium]|nr:hypothetical protein [Oligoflexia bacterium]
MKKFKDKSVKLIMKGCLVIAMIVYWNPFTVWADNSDHLVSFVPVNNSSDPLNSVADPAFDPYVCNVGLKHPITTMTEVCHSIITHAICTKGVDSNCKCKPTEGSHLGDYIKYSTIDKADETKTLAASTDDIYRMIYPVPTDITLYLNKKIYIPITSLYFNFGSELYGARYFIDVCYPDQRIESSEGYKMLSYVWEPKFLPPNDRDYLNFSHTLAAVKGICWDIEKPEVIREFHIPSQNYSEFNASTTLNFNWVQYPGENCKVSYQFMESVPNEREWQLSSSVIEIHDKTPDTKGCTLTQGYWSTHAGIGISRNSSKKYDPIWNKIPPSGPNSIFFSFDPYKSPLSWYQLLTRKVQGNKFISLGQQYIAAILNVLNSANDSQVKPYIILAENFLKKSIVTNSGVIPIINQDPIVDTASGIKVSDLILKLTLFNEGNLGPLHCDNT